MNLLTYEPSYLTDVRQTPPYANFMQKMGWQVVKYQSIPPKRRAGKYPVSRKHKSSYIYIKKLPFLPFSVAKIFRSQQIPNFKQLKKIKNKYRFLFIKYQPLIFTDQTNSQFDNLVIGKFKEDHNPLIPTKTIWLDLSQSEEQLLKAMKPKTRYNLRKCLSLTQPVRANPCVCPSINCQLISGDKISPQQLLDFYNLWKTNKPHNWLFKPSFKELKALVDSFGKKCFFILVWKLKIACPVKSRSDFFGVNCKLIAGCLILQSKNMSFYWHNCSSKEGKAHFAPTFCVWQAILESKKRGFKIFDLEGIWDERYPNLFKGWQGFTRFKQGFGGKEVEFLLPSRA
ncbi:hypothetical protein A3J78_01275 [Candidatus Beckwithbacteria bacterium RBG_13_35_6]|uniref:BioF2-like acetyltransferase domain-containing protein n=1 Tax=Candidatus Beckwithbacteria bacterium RBG_13_35_6 TaxID=1797456 RepID=A0A1F5DJ28_9BACT|nr:MAG: hypothetical protein A3J78_01275 [Candidatus Beckwithbacteria bacterium RBG_13_35_6]